MEGSRPSFEQIPALLFDIIPRVTLEEFYWQDSHYSTDSRLGREMLYLIANDEWIRTTTEVLDVSRSDAVDTTIRFDVDLDRITHEAFHAGTGQIWLPLFTLTTDGNPENEPLTVTDANGTELAAVPQADVRHQIAAALAEIIVNFTLARMPVHAAPSPFARRPSAGRDQRLLLSAALFRLLNEDTAEIAPAAAPPLDTNRLAEAKQQLRSLLVPYAEDLAADQSQPPSQIAERAARIVEAFTGSAVVVVGADRHRSPTVLSVTAPTRRLELSSPLRGPLRWLGQLRARAHIRIDLLLPSGDADRQVQVNLPDGVVLDTGRTAVPRQGMWICSGQPSAAFHLEALVRELLDGRARSHPIRRSLADMAIAEADILAETLRRHDTLPAYVTDEDALLRVTPAELAETTAAARQRLADVRGALDAIAQGEGTAQLATAWGAGGDWTGEPLLRATATDSPGPRRLNSKASHAESVSQWLIPRHARVNVPVHVQDANSVSVARFAGTMSAILMAIVGAFFWIALRRPGSPAPSVEAIASALTLFSVIPFSRIEIPDRSTLRGSLSFAGTFLVVASLVPTVLLAIIIAFDTEGHAPVVASAILFVAQVWFLATLWQGPLAPTAGINSRPPRILSTTGGPGYELAGVLRSRWWRSTTASALVTGREASAYVVWEHPGEYVWQLPDDPAEPSLHRLLGTAVRTRAYGQFAALSARIRSMRDDDDKVTEQAEVAEIDEQVLAQWPPNLLALLRSGTARQALTFLVFREPPVNWPPPGGVPVPLDPDRLAPIDEATTPLDVWIGVAREREFSLIAEHALVTVLGLAARFRLLLQDTQFPAPPPAASDDCVWARFRIGLHDPEIGRLGPFLRNLQDRLTDDPSVLRLLLRTTAAAPIREFPVNEAAPEPTAPARRLVLARELDVVAIAGRNGHADHSWRVLAICAEAHDGIEHGILKAVAVAAPRLRLAALSHAVLHGTSVLLMLCHQPEGADSLPIEDALTSALPGARAQVAIDEWQSAAQLGQNSPEPLLRVRARSQDRPGMLLDVLNALRPALRTILPDEEDPYGAVWHAMLTVAAGRASTARLSIRLQVRPEVVKNWDIPEYAEIERDARSRALLEASGRPEDFGAPENTVITVNLIEVPRSLRPALFTGGGP